MKSRNSVGGSLGEVQGSSRAKPGLGWVARTSSTCEMLKRHLEGRSARRGKIAYWEEDDSWIGYLQEYELSHPAPASAPNYSRWPSAASKLRCQFQSLGTTDHGECVQ